MEEVNYGLDCKVQSKQLKPPSKNNPTFPTLSVKVGYAYKHEHAKHKRLLKGHALAVVEIDFSFNETTKSADELRILENRTLLRYSLIDLIAEKFGALLQQEDRTIYRRQDIYDLHYLIRRISGELESFKPQILQALIASASSKQLNVNKTSMDDGNIKSRTKREYDLLSREISTGQLPDFNEAYETVMRFYMSLPWESV